MLGTRHQDDWYFYQDALSLMTAKSTMNWMREKGYKIRQLVPQNDVNIGARYYGKPVGKRPEFIPLDNSLNTDGKRAHDRHVAVTLHLPLDNDQKFCNCTPRLINRNLKRIVESTGIGCPSSEQIINNCDEAFDAMWTAYNADGAIFLVQQITMVKVTVRQGREIMLRER